jgi:hypothetical protein
LTQTQYIRVEKLGNDDQQDVVEIISGPGFYIPNDPYATISEVKNKISLSKNMYIRIVDERTGEKKIISGPMMYTLGPYEKCGKVQNKPNLSNVQYIIVRDEEHGSMKTVEGPALYTPGPFETHSDVMDKIRLSNTDYCYVTHGEGGHIDILVGPQVFAPLPYDVISSTMSKLVLKKFEYIKIVDNNSGIIRVEKGPATIILQPYEHSVQEKQTAVEINDHHAALVYNTDTGNHELICMRTDYDVDDDNDVVDTRPYGPFLFFPSPTQEIEEIREKIRLEQHECMVIVDKNGKYSFRRGSDETRSFFIPPYCHVLEQEWSDDLQKTKTTVKRVSRFDLRPQYMDFRFEIRTKDNVGIYIDLNFYWQIMNIEKMISVTPDAHEDICKHAMSQILSESSRRDMKEFMESFNEIIHDAISKDDGFYDQRGVTIHKVETTGCHCKDPSTEAIFHEIIKEKTNRIKNMEKQHGDNEVRKSLLENEIEIEKLEGLKLQVHKKFMREEATADGQSEADRIAHFLSGLPTELTTEDKLRIYFDQKNTDRVNHVANSGAQLYLTREEMDITLVNNTYRGNESTPTVPKVPMGTTTSVKGRK